MTEDELRAWRAKSEGEKDTFILKTCAEMLIHSKDREGSKALQTAHILNLEKENKDAKNQRKALRKSEDGRVVVEKELKKERLCLSILEKEASDL